MSNVRRIGFVLLGAAVAISAADPEAEALFRKVRAKVLDDIQHVPRYTCVQTVKRAQYRPQYGPRPLNCRMMIAARKELGSPGLLISRDRLRLDVAVVDGAETFSWAGARQFETSRVDDLVKSGATGSGEFVSFLTSVFGADTDSIASLGQASFAFNVPKEKSHYRYRTTGPERTAGYHGSFLVDPNTADVKRLSVITDDFPPEEETCSVEDTMDYHRLKIGNGDFLLPEVATMDVLYNSGTESINETRYSECREYTGESTIRFDDDAAPDTTTPSAPAIPPAQATAPKALPAGLRFRIGMSTPIHSETAAAGDTVTGVVLRDVKAGKLGIVARQNDMVHGRILQLEQRNFPQAHWILRIRFDSLERKDGSSKAVEQPLTLQARDGNNGAFIFGQAGEFVIDQSFHSEWETR